MYIIIGVRQNCFTPFLFWWVMKIDEIGYIQLLDTYKGLLTPTKAEIADMYFGCDLSLTEIAEIKSCTRQSVLDAIKTVKAELLDFESKVGFLTYKNKINDFAKNLTDADRQNLNIILEK